MNLPKVNGEILLNSSLAKYSWFQVGGNAEAIFIPKDISNLESFLKNLEKDIPITIIGGGSNLLIRDGGVDGVAIITKNTLKNIAINNNIIEVESGVLNSKLFEFAKKNGIGGYEFLGTIPGTIGGAVRGNAGCYGSEIKDLLVSIDALDTDGNKKTFTKDDCRFEYRKNNLPNNLIFTKIFLRADVKKDISEIEKTYNEMMEKRFKSQPSGVKTCGSTFKNVPDNPAWKIIQELGYQDKEINGAKMSEKHANFMVNTGKATAKDLEELGEKIIIEAKEKLNINLEWEIKIIGKNNE